MYFYTDFSMIDKIKSFIKLHMFGHTVETKDRIKYSSGRNLCYILINNYRKFENNFLKDEDPHLREAKHTLAQTAF